MDVLDLVIVVVAAAVAMGGYRLGFLGRVTSWIGLALGFYLAIRLLPDVVSDFATSSPGVILFIAVLVIVGGAMIGQAVGLVVAARIHRVIPPGPLRQIDRVVGAIVGAMGVLVLVWLLIPSVASVPGWPARLTASSGVARLFSRDLPAPPNALQVLRQLIGNGAPEVFAAVHADSPAGPPPANSPLSQAVTASVIASTVKVEGQACGFTLEGSGFAVGPGLVVTNAHVVAGEPRGRTAVLLPSGRQAPATVVMFDPRRDIALLRVRTLDEQPLSLGTDSDGTTGAVFGHPEGQDAIAVIPARVALIEDATGLDLYGQHTITRQILVLAASIVHGDSGAPLVTAQGLVVGVVFATAADQSGTAYALASSELQQALVETRAPNGTSTGRCLVG